MLSSSLEIPSSIILGQYLDDKIIKNWSASGAPRALFGIKIASLLLLDESP
jgi:hypothetical protein